MYNCCTKGSKENIYERIEKGNIDIDLYTVQQFTMFTMTREKLVLQGLKFGLSKAIDRSCYLYEVK